MFSNLDHKFMDQSMHLICFLFIGRWRIEQKFIAWMMLF